VERIAAMFPGHSRADIAQDLALTGNSQDTVERLLDGRFEVRKKTCRRLLTECSCGSEQSEAEEIRG
jgi:hypothetical protein